MIEGKKYVIRLMNFTDRASSDGLSLYILYEFNGVAKCIYLEARDIPNKIVFSNDDQSFIVFKEKKGLLDSKLVVETVSISREQYGGL